MARFFFHLRTGEDMCLDPDGVILPDIEAATLEALRVAREIAGEAVRFANDDVPDTVIIADDAGHELGTVDFADVIPDRLCK